MREIKFRVWDKKNKKMYYGYEPDRPNMIDLDGNLYITGAGNKDEYGGPTDYISGCDQENYILMQYTGRKDVNGKEIYEGDIIADDAGRIIGYVIYDETSAVYLLKFELGGDYYLNRFTEYKIIGNIYQNPELLEEE